jgi:histidine triad (HIT) family protein
VDSCTFCRIADGRSGAKLVYEDELAVAFRDINPQGPVHVLVIPRQHLRSLADAGPDHEALLGHLLLVASRVAREADLQEGYRTVINTGAEGGQTVLHLHLHVIGGRPMHWPPG